MYTVIIEHMYKYPCNVIRDDITGLFLSYIDILDRDKNAYKACVGAENRVYQWFINGLSMTYQ